MKAKELIELLSLIEPETELGLSVGCVKPCKLTSMEVHNNMLCFSNDQVAYKDSQTYTNLKHMIGALSYFAKESDYDRGYRDCINKSKELLGIDLESQFKNITKE